MTCPAPSRRADGPTDPDEAVLLTVEATPLGVRAALAEMRSRLAAGLPDPGMLGTAETVLAEVLNNIVEHAYGGEAGGVIELRLRDAGSLLSVDVRDRGAPMPGGAAPGGILPGETGPDDDPPEGGFGWFLIRALARNVAYARRDGENRLTFCVPIRDGC